MQFFIIDISGLIYRAFYASEKLNLEQNNLFGAVFFLARMIFGLNKFIEKESSSFDNFWCAAIDSFRETERNKIFKEYKAQRKKTPNELIRQMPKINEILEMAEIQMPGASGFEADDIIASYVSQMHSKFKKITIISSDKDFMQLVSNEKNIVIFDPIKKIIFKEINVFQKFGIMPEKFCDLQSLSGDAADNIKFTKGIGIKTASKLIKDYGSLELILKNVESITPQKTKEIIKKNISNIMLTKELVTLKKDLPLPIETENMKVPKNFGKENLILINNFLKNLAKIEE